MVELPREPHSKLMQYHPVVIEGMGGYDQRDPADVAKQVAEQLIKHWARRAPSKPLLVMTQGDPREDTGISAVTPRVAERFGVSRGLVCLDEHIADYHSANADRQNVSLELRYSKLAEQLDCREPGTVHRIEAAIDRQIEAKNGQRKKLAKPPLKPYFRDFALLQEVTKAACSQLCERLTVIHTSTDIHAFSVTSFYTVGLELGLVASEDIVSYAPDSPGAMTTTPREGEHGIFQ